MANMDIFLCGVDGDISKCSAGRLQDLMEQSTSEFLGIQNIRHHPFPTPFDPWPCEAEEALSRTPQAAAGLIVSFSALTEAWRQLPGWLAGFLCAPEQTGAVVLRRAAIDEVGKIFEGPFALWDWSLQAVQRGWDLAWVEGKLSETSAEARAVMDLPALVPREPGPEMAWLHKHITELQLESRLSKVASRPDATALKAGLLQRHDYLEESHQYSQSVQGEGRHRAGDYWHAIMHRREPDYSNSKYWYGRVGHHPIFPELARRADAILQRCSSPATPDWRARLKTPGDWDARAFVDLCAACEHSHDSALETAARDIQFQEMLLLLVQTYDDATGR